MNQPPEVSYVSSGDVSIAYQSFGSGPGCLVIIPGILSHIESVWSRPEASRLFRAFAKFTRLVLLDKRGIGLSDALLGSAHQLTRERASDLTVVMDALGLERTALFGIADGGPVAATFAAANPHRVDTLVLYGSWARLTHPSFPDGYPEDVAKARLRSVAERWGSDTNPLLLEGLIQSLVNDTDWRLWLAHMQRLAASPAAAVALYDAMMKLDVRDILPSIRARTLVLHTAGDQLVPVQNGRYLAEHITGARLVELDGADHMPFANVDHVSAVIQEFLTGRQSHSDADRRVATIVFTDVVASTRAAGTLGNRRWADLLDTMMARLGLLVREHEGEVVDTAGDGMLALFKGPRHAISCAEAMLELVHTLDLEARAGIHSGEVEIRGDRVMGMAVHTAARIAALARSGEVMTSRTVKDLVAGSGLSFSERGVHTLKGVPDKWELYSVCSKR